MMINKLSSLVALLLLAVIGTSCSWIMNDKGDDDRRIPQPPPGSTKREKPWNETQRFEAEATMPLATPRR